MASWAKTLSVELAPMGITVNNILPGSIQTQRLESLWRYQAEQTGVPLESILEQTLQQIPMRRIGQPEEVAALALFLASPLAGYITGVSIPVDGGRTRCL
jgi:3-oxoacyl-[acyl-carrier protein] reductase